jgi:hypothetical protein
MLVDDEYQNDTSSERRSRSKSAKSRQRDSSQDVEMTGVPSPQVQQLAIRKGKSIVETPVPLPPQYRLSQLAAPTPSTPVRPAPAQSTPVQPISAPTTPAPTTPVDVLLDVLNEIALGRDLTKTNANTIHTQLYLLCRIKPYKAPAEVTAFYAKELLLRLPAMWKDTDFYNHLRRATQRPLVLELTTAEEIPNLCERRNKAPHRIPRAPRNRSSLPQPNSDSEEDVNAGRRARKAGKAAGLRLASSSKKRPASEMDFDGQPVTGRPSGKKAAKLSHVATEDDENSSSDESDSVSVLGADDDHDQTGFLVSPPPDAVKVVVTAELVPTMSPTGPNGTWVCDQEGCNHIVRAANDPLGQDLVQAHFRHHEAQVERMTLAMTESRGHLPIKYVESCPFPRLSINIVTNSPSSNQRWYSHLLDKIQALGKKAMELKNGASNGEEAPAPVKRRLLL